MQNSLENKLLNNQQEKLSEMDLSNRIEDLLEESVPRGKKHTEWQTKIEEEDLDRNALENLLLEIEEFLEQLKQFQNRKFSSQKKEGFISESFSGLDEDLRKDSARKIRAVAEEALSGGLKKIGFGMSAGVFISKKHPEYCYKIITDPEVYKKDCTVQEECEFLSEMLKIKVDGVRVPRPYYYYMDENVHLIVMENLDAVTLEDLKEGRAELPENFNFEKVSADLKEFFRIMHDELKIYHRDFHDKNLMIDKNGLPCVIDPGKAKRKTSDEEEMYRAINHVLGERDVYINDKIALNDNIAALKKINKRREGKNV